MAEYKAATISFENMLHDFPSTKLKPKVYDYIMQAKSELAINSVYDLKKDRLDNAIAFSRQVEKEYPDTNSSKQAISLREKMLKEKEKHEALTKQVEARKAEIMEKQKKEELKLKEKEQAKTNS